MKIQEVLNSSILGSWKGTLESDTYFRLRAAIYLHNESHQSPLVART